FAVRPDGKGLRFIRPEIAEGTWLEGGRRYRLAGSTGSKNSTIRQSYHWQVRPHPAPERLQNPQRRRWRVASAVTHCRRGDPFDEAQEHAVPARWCRACTCGGRAPPNFQ